MSFNQVAHSEKNDQDNASRDDGGTGRDQNEENSIADHLPEAESPDGTVDSTNAKNGEKNGKESTDENDPHIVKFTETMDETNEHLLSYNNDIHNKVFFKRSYNFKFL